MTQYICPICGKRVCDSHKSLHLAKLSPDNEDKADIIVKCKNCKNILAIKVNDHTFLWENAFRTAL